MHHPLQEDTGLHASLASESASQAQPHHQDARPAIPQVQASCPEICKIRYHQSTSKADAQVLHHLNLPLTAADLRSEELTP